MGKNLPVNYLKNTSGTQRYNPIYAKKFKKQAKSLVQNRQNLKLKVETAVIDFLKEGRESHFYRKKLKGSLAPMEELQVTGDVRIFVTIDDHNRVAVLEAIGTHAQLGI